MSSLQGFPPRDAANSVRFVRSLVAGVVAWLVAGAAAAQPNIVYILADDLGYGTLNSYGASTSLVQTPNIDRLASEGMRFTDASTPSSVCSPTRYGVLMGEYPLRSDRQWGVVNTNDPLLPDDEQQTVADWLKSEGYSTSAIGKWHLGFQDQSRSGNAGGAAGWLDPLDPGPRALGFDYFFGIPQNHDDITGAFVENEGIYQLQSDNIDPNPGTSSYGSTYLGLDVPELVLEETMETLTDKAVDWLDQHSGASEPFFMYYAPVALHVPITPSTDTAGTSGAGDYGDFLHDLDISVGRVLDKLDEMGVADDTLVVFTSDNGGDAFTESNASGIDINGGLRGDKHTIWEGGTRVPLMARLPGQIEAGATSNQMINLVDTFATVVDLVNPANSVVGGAASDSVSFLDALLQPDDADPGRESMITANSDGILAIRRGAWKYVEGEHPEGSPNSGVSNDQTYAQLYNLVDDPTESADVLSLYPEVVAALQAELDRARDYGHTLGDPGDLNFDGVLDDADLERFVLNWRRDTSQLPNLEMVGAGDYDLSGRTDYGDWFILRDAFQEAGVELASLETLLLRVPEPNTSLLSAMALLGGGATRRSRRGVETPLAVDHGID